MRLKQVDALRGIAALSVTIFHLTGSAGLSKLMASHGRYGYLGVEMFFVISGFVLPYSMLKTGYVVRDFFKFMLKRLIRIYPAYLATIALYVVIVLLTGREKIFISTVMSDMLFISYITHHPSTSVVFWTLCIEFQFYILIGLLYNFTSKSNINSLITIGVIIAASFFLNYGEYIMHWFSFFALGILIFNRKYTGMPLLTFWIVAAVLIATSAYINGIPEAIAGCGAFLFILFVRMESKTVINKTLLWLGTISYSLYLVHWELGRTAVNVSRHLPLVGNIEALKVVIGVAFSIICAWMLYMIVEKPSIKYANGVKYSSRP